MTRHETLVALAKVINTTHAVLGGFIGTDAVERYPNGVLVEEALVESASFFGLSVGLEEAHDIAIEIGATNFDLSDNEDQAISLFQ